MLSNIVVFDTLDPPIYASKWISNNNGTFFGSFIFVKKNAKKSGEVP
jgi:hypothetical protein